MKKIILSFIGFSILGFSFPSQAYRLLDEKITSTPGFNFQVEHNYDTKKKIMSARARSTAPNRTGRIGQYIQIDGYHEIDITNFTNKSQRYEYTVTLECEVSKGSYTRHIELKPNEHFSTNEHTYGAVQKFTPGLFKISAITKISGESSAFDTGHGNLTISK